MTSRHLPTSLLLQPDPEPQHSKVLRFVSVSQGKQNWTSWHELKPATSAAQLKRPTPDDDSCPPERDKEAGKAGRKLEQAEMRSKKLKRDGEAHNMSREEHRMTQCRAHYAKNKQEGDGGEEGVAVRKKRAKCPHNRTKSQCWG